MFVGTRDLLFTIGRGTFLCPRCDGEKDFRRRSVRRFGALLGLPLLPLGHEGTWVECLSCENLFEADVLSDDPARRSAASEPVRARAVRRVLVDMMLADGVTEEREIAALKRLCAEVAELTLSDADVQAEIERARRDTTKTLDYLARCRVLLDRAGREAVLTAAVAMAAADGVFQEEERQLLYRMGIVLGVPGDQINGLISAYS